MKYENVIIYSKGRFKDATQSIRRALRYAVKDEILSIPIKYQYLQSKTKGESATSDDNIIGQVLNIRKDDATGNIIGDVEINDVFSNSVNYVGEIDNVVVKADVDPKTKQPAAGTEEIVNFVIYNRAAKNQVTSNLKKLTMSSLYGVMRNHNAPSESAAALPRSDENPLIKNKDKIQEAINKEFGNTPGI